MSRIGFVGLGKLGLPVALSINSHGHEVMGYDINPAVKGYLDERAIPFKEEGIEPLLEKHSVQWAESVQDVVEWADIVFVPVQTPHQPQFEGSTRLPAERADFDYSWLTEAVSEVAKWCLYYEKHTTVVVISTCLPGTYEKRIKQLLNQYVHYVYNPFFIAMGTVVHDFENPEFVLLGIDRHVVPEGVVHPASNIGDLYRSVHDKRLFVTDITTAEGIKVFYNTFITAKTLLANSWMQTAHKTGMNIDDITAALSLATDRLLSPKYLRGGGPDAGGCHPRDLIALSWLGREIDLKPNWFEMMAQARELQTEWTADLVQDYWTQTRLPIIVLGKAFKPETNLTVGSGATLLVNMLKERELPVMQWDPHLDEGALSSQRAIYLVATQHKAFDHLNYQAGSIIIDLWRYITPKEGVKIVGVGNALR